MNAELAPLHGRLLRQPGEFETLLQRVARIEALNRTLQQWTREPWLASIRVANLREDTLVVYSENAAALTSLRYRRDALLAWFRDQHGISVNKLQTSVKPRRSAGRV